MSLWVLVQVLLNLIFAAGLAATWIRFKRPAAEDPRLSRGLQLLQSKIAILEDLSDRTDVQVKQLNALLETKCMEIQNKILESEKFIHQIEASRQKSMEIAKMFEDRIPHQEIVERQNTVKYVKAARLAHQGVPVAEILKQVDISQAEVEFIAKVNRDQLMFSEENLPAWIQDQIQTPGSRVNTPALNEEAQIEISKPTLMNQDAMKKLGEQFQKAVHMAEKTKALSVNPTGDFQLSQQSFMEIELPPTPEEKAKPVPPPAPTAPSNNTATGDIQMAINAKGKPVQVRPVAFPRISNEEI